MSRQETMTPDVAAIVLDVPAGASRSEIAAAYRLRARLVHPDRFVDASEVERRAANREFARITDAKDALLAAAPAPAPRTAAADRPGGPTQGSNTAADPPRARPVPLSFDEFVARAESTAQPWDGPVTPRRPVRRFGMRTLVVASIALVAVAFLGAGVVSQATSSSGSATGSYDRTGTHASSAPTGRTGRVAHSGGARDAAAAGWIELTRSNWRVLSTATDCTTNTGCFDVDITPLGSCRDAELRWGLTQYDDRVPSSLVTVRTPLVADRTNHVVVPIPRGHRDFYIDLDEASCPG
ncbi:J domain-containing protein [Curtobacterium sp. MCBD17_035]|uniref:J domain-containing protein n=1 Tax=Curtobacterium sp. MCBD17_035 TaxID=2175673 RepID=UPI000DAA53F1|nr:J domain-containing protein [Curtobacterium sp. MCBD17_035]WIB66816.1 J domain-containing protein [Curtobacterium sp. MCBD17_035]